jgi:hypothetical protein
MNERFAVVLMGAKAVIYTEQADVPIEDRKRMLSLDAFQTWFRNRRTEYRASDGAIRTTDWAKAWLDSPDRRQYFGVEFSPPDNDGNAVTTPGYLNLWSGFAVTPAETPDVKRYKTFHDHLLNNVAGGDQALFRWVFGFLAHLTQRPRERIGVALVLRGGMGVGKSKVGEVIGRLFPAHWALVSSARYVTGNFNVHQATCLLLQADEAVWAGDKAAEGRLKDLITSSIQYVEAKGIDPIRVANFVRVMMTANESWVVPAGKDERRFAVLDVDPRCKQNSEYFAEMERELADGGLEHLLGALLNFDLKSVDLRKIPKTEALLEQKVRSFNSVEAWLYDRLQAGTPTRHLSEWKTEVPVDDVYEDYIWSSERIGIKRKQERTTFGTTLNRLLGNSLRKTRPRMQVEDARGHIKIDRVWCYVLPSLGEARAAFEAVIEQSPTWDVVADDDDEATAAHERDKDDLPPL